MSRDYRTSKPGDHAPIECATARAAYDRRETDDAGGYHAGWGICAGTVAPTGAPNGCVRPAVLSPFVRNALAGRLPAKEYAR